MFMDLKSRECVVCSKKEMGAYSCRQCLIYIGTCVVFLNMSSSTDSIVASNLHLNVVLLQHFLSHPHLFLFMANDNLTLQRKD